MRKHRSSGASF